MAASCLSAVPGHSWPFQKAVGAQGRGFAQSSPGAVVTGHPCADGAHTLTEMVGKEPPGGRKEGPGGARGGWGLEGEGRLRGLASL